MRNNRIWKVCYFSIYIMIFFVFFSIMSTCGFLEALVESIKKEQEVICEEEAYLYRKMPDAEMDICHQNILSSSLWLED